MYGMRKRRYVDVQPVFFLIAFGAAAAPLFAQSATRDLSGHSLPGVTFTVSIAIETPPGTNALGLEDLPPTGWVVSAISDGGTFDVANEKVKWAFFFEPFPTGVTYDVRDPTGAAGEFCFEGTVSFDGPVQPIGGDLCIVPPPVTVRGDSPRYLAITLPPSPDPVGLVVTPGCPGGITRFVGAPAGPHNIATLTSDPAGAAFLDSAGWGGTVHVTGIDVVPGTEYAVQLDTGTPGSPELSAVALASTTIWGDVASAFVDGQWGPPDGTVEVTADLLAILDSFRGLPTGPPLYRVDLIGPGLTGEACAPDQVIDIFEVVADLAAFQGLDFQISTRCGAVCP